MISNTQQISMKSAVVLNDDLNGGCNLQVLILRMTDNQLCNQIFNNKDTIFNMVKYTWLSPDFRKQKNLAQQYNHTALYRTFHRSTENTFEHKNKKYLKRISKQHFCKTDIYLVLIKYLQVLFLYKNTYILNRLSH